MELGWLGLAVAVFLFSHSLTNRRAFRHWAERVLGGHVPFILAYSVVSILLLAWIIAAYRAAPVFLLWGQEPWMRWVPPLAMGPACVLLGAGMLTPNPFSIGPGGRGYDAARPGLLRLTRHPILWGLALWAGAHIVPNGDVGALMIFSPLFVLALIGPRILDSKRKTRMGAQTWSDLARLTSRPHWRFASEMGVVRWLAGPTLYALLFLAHEVAIGASPVP